MPAEGRQVLVALALALGALTSAESAPRRQLLHFSDVHLNLSTSLLAADSALIPTRYYSDAPIALLESALSHAKQHVLADPDLFLYTGDHAAHGQFTDEYIARAVEANVHAMEDFYPPKDGVLLETTAIIGNADGNPDYHMKVTDPTKETNPSIELISKVWEDSLSAANMDLLNRRGYLQYALDANLRVLTLNTVPYSVRSHVPDTSKQSDPFGQFAWLDSTLAELQKAGKFAYLVGHIAPIVDSYGGNPQWHPKYIQTYKRIVGRYADVVKAQFFGHVHSIEFRVPVASLDDGGKDGEGFQLPPMFISGSISPLFGNNPSFMVWDFDSETYEVLDFAVYGTNISDSEPQLDWKLLFQASEAYGLASLSLAELSDFVLRLGQNSSLLEDYYYNMKAQSPLTRPCSTPLCHVKTLCTLKWWTTKGQYQACVDSVQMMTAGKARGGGQASVPSTHAVLVTSDVFMAIGSTALATGVAAACVIAIVQALKRGGVLKTRDERAAQYENVFPML
ncbi:hypothetical protein BBJ28_00004749 [Nothophytophthora sp. Chile5]|nr:hypothetical protein BBJ28_00004749 [Nothophytophthora sp. Chile5]